MKGSIRKRGSTWYYSFDLGIIEGKRKRKEKGGFRTKKECELALRQALNDYEMSGKVFEASSIAFIDFAETWKEYVKLNVNCH